MSSIALSFNAVTVAALMLNAAMCALSARSRSHPPIVALTYNNDGCSVLIVCTILSDVGFLTGTLVVNETIVSSKALDLMSSDTISLTLTHSTVVYTNITAECYAYNGKSSSAKMFMKSQVKELSTHGTFGLLASHRYDSLLRHQNAATRSTATVASAATAPSSISPSPLQATAAFPKIATVETAQNSATVIAKTGTDAARSERDQMCSQSALLGFLVCLQPLLVLATWYLTRSRCMVSTARVSLIRYGYLNLRK